MNLRILGPIAVIPVPYIASFDAAPEGFEHAQSDRCDGDVFRWKRLPGASDENPGVSSWLSRMCDFTLSNMARRRRKLHREFPFLMTCFGRGRKYCRCPDLLKPLCREVFLSELRSPIPLRVCSGERAFGYTAIDNRIFRPWTPFDREPSDSIKMTYAFLISKADNVTRWVYARPSKRAEERGIPERTLVEHEKALERLGLVLRIPYCKINRKSVRRFRTIILLDIPRGFANASDEIENDMDNAWARNEQQRLAKHLAPREFIEAQIDEDIGESDDSDWGAA